MTHKLLTNSFPVLMYSHLGHRFRAANFNYQNYDKVVYDILTCVFGNAFSDEIWLWIYWFLRVSDRVEAIYAHADPLSRCAHQ